MYEELDLSEENFVFEKIAGRTKGFYADKDAVVEIELTYHQWCAKQKQRAFIKKECTKMKSDLQKRLLK